MSSYLSGSAKLFSAIKKQGSFKAHEDANEAYVEQRKLVKQAKATLAKLDGTTSKWTGSSKKPSKKHKEAVAIVSQPYPDLQADYVSDLEKAKEAVKKATNAELAAMDLFQLYANLLSVDAKYVWNKIIHKKTQSDPTWTYSLQGCSKKGPRGYTCKSFNNCVIFYLLTMFPNSAAEQVWYYITNVLKKPQRISMHQVMQRIEQLNFYIAQLPCWFYSPSAKPSTLSMNVPFTEADLVSHAIRMCPHTWQDHFNHHKKSMTPMDMHSLLMSLKTIERMCAQETSNAPSNKKAFNKSKKGRQRPGTEYTTRVLEKVCFEKHCNLCKKHGGAYSIHNTKD